MNMSSLKLIATAIAFATAISPYVCAAQTTAIKSNANAEHELTVARADLARAAKRVAELSLTAGHPDARVTMQKRIDIRPIVGVVLVPDLHAGVRIAGVTPQGPAATSGMKSGDRLLTINGAQILGQEASQRVENARKLLAELNIKTPAKLGYARDGRNAVASVTPRMDRHVSVWSGDGGGDGGTFKFDFDDTDLQRMLPAGIAPQIRKELIRIGPDGACKGEACSFDVLSEAFRWNGLNLATIDPQLGRYFGADRGVLVLSAGQDLAGLQSGDVIRKIDGKSVASPREAMAVLRAKPAATKVAVDYLRDRKAAVAQITVPKAVRFEMPAPPAPPTPPAAPNAPRVPSSAVAPAPVSVPRIVESRKIVTIDRNGKRQISESSDDEMPALPAPPAPPQPPSPPTAPIN
ncbi:MAG: PDZ domain-containing protein [Luteimonas sp.]